MSDSSKQDVSTASGTRKTRGGMRSLQKYIEDAYHSLMKGKACPDFSDRRVLNKVFSNVMDDVEGIASRKLYDQCYDKVIVSLSGLTERNVATVDEMFKNCAPEGATWLENWESYIDDIHQELKHASSNPEATSSYSSEMLEAILADVKDVAPPSLYEQFVRAVGSVKHELEQATDEETWLQTLKGCAPLKQADSVKTKSWENQLCEEFERKYQDPDGFVLSSFVKCIDQYYVMWNSNSLWCAPCTAIVQSSGWGKSRLVREIAIAPNHIMVFYFSLMRPERAGHPLSDPAILRHFLNIKSEENAYAIFHACFHWLSEQDSFPKKDDLFVDHQKKKYHRILPTILHKPKCSKEEMVNACMKAVDPHSTS